MLRVNSQCVLKVFAGSHGISRTRLQHAQVIPVVRVSRLYRERGVQLANCVGWLTHLIVQLRELTVRHSVARAQALNRLELLQRVGKAAGLDVDVTQQLMSIGIILLPERLL